MLAVTSTLVSDPSVGLATVGVRDPGSTRVVYAIVVALALLGLALAVFAWWLFRVTRPDPELLAPLETMQTSEWQRLDPAGRRRLLDEVRPEGADPVDPAPAAPEPDEEFADVPEQRDVRELAEERVSGTGAAVGEAGSRSEGPTAPAISDDEWSVWDAELGLDPVASGDDTRDEERSQ